MCSNAPIPLEVWRQTATDRTLPFQQVKHMFTMREKYCVKQISYQEY